MLIAMQLAAIAVNATCDNPWGEFLVVEQETECVLAFSPNMGGRLQRGSCYDGCLLHSIACLAPFLVCMVSRSQKKILYDRSLDVLNIGAVILWLLEMYQPVNRKCNRIGQFSLSWTLASQYCVKWDRINEVLLYCQLKWQRVRIFSASLQFDKFRLSHQGWINVISL